MDQNRDHLDSVIKQVFVRMKKLRPKPSACPDDELFAAYLEGALAEDERKQIEDHLVVCKKCTDNLISFAEVESRDQPGEEIFVTKKMVKQTKGLVKPHVPLDLWERVSSWFSVFRPIPAMVTVSALLVVAVGLYNLYAPDSPSPVISLNIIARISSGIPIRGTTPDYKEVEVQDGGELQSGDMFRIKFELEEEAYVYLLSLDTLGNLSKVLPAEDTGVPIKMKAHQTYIVPEDDGWFRLDDNTGQETLYLLASSEAIEDIDQRFDQLRKSGIDKITKIFPGAKIQSFSFMHE